jgi:hypothetical protein
LNPEPRSLPLVAGLVLLILAFAGMHLRSFPPAPRPASAPNSEFSAERAYDVLRSLVGDGVPHPLGSAANARMRARILERFAGLGYQPSVQTAFSCHQRAQACGLVHNVIAIRPGRTAGKAVMLASHYDSVPAGPGASDDGVGVAVTLEVARALASEAEYRNPVVFLIDEGEEAGLLGAEAFVQHHPLATQIGAVVNVEARGTSGTSIMFETSDQNRWLIDVLARSLARPIASSVFYPIYERLPNDTDLTVFKRAGMPGVNFAFVGDVPRYHTPLDNVEFASRASVQHHGDNALAMVRALANEDLVQPRHGNAVFFDLLGFAIVRWPTSLTLPLAGLSLVLIIVAAAGMRLRRGAPIWRGLLGLVAWILMVAAAGGGTFGLQRWLTHLGAWPGGATTRPAISVLAFWLAGLAVASLVAAVFGRWTRSAGAWTGCWIGWAVCGIAAALTFPDASYVLIVPALVAGVAGTTALLRPIATTHVGVLRVILPVAAAAVLIMPTAWLLFDGIGPDGLPAAGTAIALIATGLAAAIASAGKTRWLLPLSTLAATAALSISVVSTPAFSAARPERMNFTFIQEGGATGARWTVAPQSGVLPESIARAVSFRREAPSPWATGIAFVADAPPVPAAAPTVEVLHQESRNGHRNVRLRARSPRGGSQLLLMLPASPPRLVSLSMGGFPFVSSAPGGRIAVRGYVSHHVPPEGVELELALDGESPVEAFVIDRTFGLPPAGEHLVRARPAEATPAGLGDVTVLYTRLRF